jgi:hypothetical protein
VRRNFRAAVHHKPISRLITARIPLQAGHNRFPTGTAIAVRGSCDPLKSGRHESPHQLRQACRQKRRAWNASGGNRWPRPVRRAKSVATSRRRRTKFGNRRRNRGPTLIANCRANGRRLQSVKHRARCRRRSASRARCHAANHHVRRPRATASAVAIRDATSDRTDAVRASRSPGRRLSACGRGRDSFR